MKLHSWLQVDMPTLPVELTSRAEAGFLIQRNTFGVGD